MRKPPEGGANVFQIFKKVKMILFYIKNDPDFRKEAQKAVGIFTGFGYKKSGMPYADVSMNGL